MAIARRAIVYQVRTPIAAAAIQAWNSVPIAIAPAPGPNRRIHLVGLDVQSAFGTVPFAALQDVATSANFRVYLDAAHPLNSSTISGQTTGILGASANRSFSYTGNTYGTAIGGSSATAIDPTDSINKPLMLVGNADQSAGQIATSTINAAGLLYAANDTGTIDPSNNGTATYRVLTVGGGGQVLTYSITAAGNGYVVANGLATDASGAGTGFKVNVTGINKGDGSLITTVFYGIVQLL